jgi:hypothetical protein
LAHIGEASGSEIVDADDLGAFGKQGLAKMRPEEAGAAGDYTRSSYFSHAIRLSSGATGSERSSRRSRVPIGREQLKNMKVPGFLR